MSFFFNSQDTSESQIQQESVVQQNVTEVDTASELVNVDKGNSILGDSETQVDLPQQAISNNEVSSNIFQQTSNFITEDSDDNLQNSNVEENNNNDNDTVLEPPINTQIDNTDELEMGQRESSPLAVIVVSDEDIEKNETASPTEEIETPKVLEDDSDDSSSTFQLPPEFIAEESNESLPIINTPNKLKTFDIQKDSSLEISKNDHQIVEIDVVKMDTVTENDENDTPNSPFNIKKCALKFNPVDKETLKNHDIGIDMECFKNYYLNEVDKDFKTNTTNNINNQDSVVSDGVDKSAKKTGLKRRRRMQEVHSKKRKMEEEKAKRELRRCKRRNTVTENIKLTFGSEQKRKKRRRRKNKIKIKVSISDVDMPVKIKWRRQQQLRLKISEIKNKKKPKKKLTDNKSTLKQYILNPTQCPSDEIIVKPEKEVSPPKRKYIKHEKLTDNLVQTSLRNFFTVKSSAERHYP